MTTRPGILLSLDGSEKDDRALAVAAAFARLADANVHIVRVFQEAGALPIGPQRLGAVRADVEASLRTGIEKDVRKAGEWLRERAPHQVTIEVIDGDDVAATLLSRAESQDVRAIVMATRGAGMFGRTLLGSVADEVVRAAWPPVLLVPPGTADMGGRDVRLRRALIPQDGSPRAFEVIPSLLSLPLTRELEIVLLQVVQRERTGGHAMPPGSESLHLNAEIAERRLGEAAERLRDAGASVEVVVVESGDPASVIVDSIRQSLPDFIAMTTRGAGGLRRLLLGSVANRVVRESEVPVYLVTRSERR